MNNMGKKKLKELIVAFVLLFSALISLRVNNGEKIAGQTPCVSEIANLLKEENLQIHFPDVGQGDCQIILDSNRNAVIIDSGTKESVSQLLYYLGEIDVENIEYFVITHPHSDHIGGAQEIIIKYGVDNVIMADSTENTAVFNDLIDLLYKEKQRNRTNVIKVERGFEFEFDDAEFTILAPWKTNTDNLNNESIVVKMNYGNFSALFTGDAEKDIEEKLIECNDNLHSTIIKVGHHGSDTSSSKGFIEKVRPEIAVISVGKDNDYGHPKRRVINDYEDAGVKVLRTDENGWVAVQTDGIGYSVYFEKN